MGPGPGVRTDVRDGAAERRAAATSTGPGRPAALAALPAPAALSARSGPAAPADASAHPAPTVTEGTSK